MAMRLATIHVAHIRRLMMMDIYASRMSPNHAQNGPASSPGSSRLYCNVYVEQTQNEVIATADMTVVKSNVSRNDVNKLTKFILLLDLFRIHIECNDRVTKD